MSEIETIKMNEEIEIRTEKHHWKPNDWIYTFYYKPKENRFTSFSISTYWGDKPAMYEIQDDVTILYSNNNSQYLNKIETKQLPILLDFLNNRCNHYPKEVVRKKKIKTIKELLNECDIGYFSIGYNETRTINYALFREVIAYAKSYNGVLLFFRKRGGLLCYNISKVIFECDRWTESKAHHLSLKKGYNILKQVQKEKTGIVYLPKDIEKEIVDTVILDSI